MAIIFKKHFKEVIKNMSIIMVQISLWSCSELSIFG